MIYLYLYADLVHDGALVRYGSSDQYTPQYDPRKGRRMVHMDTNLPHSTSELRAYLMVWMEHKRQERVCCRSGNSRELPQQNRQGTIYVGGDLHLDTIKEAKFSLHKAVECLLNPWFEWDDWTSWIAFWMPLAFLSSAPNRPFVTILPCYKLCKMSIYATFQKRVIFPVVSVSSSLFE